MAANVIPLSRGEGVAITFNIVDAANSLLGKRVTWSLADSPLAFASGAAPAAPTSVLKKASALGASSVDVTIATQTAGQITGTVNVKISDYASLPKTQYVASLWVDDGNGNDRCVTQGGFDIVTIAGASPR